MLILDIITKIIMVQRRAITDPLFGSLEYMQYLDYGLQLEPKRDDFIIRKGFDIVVSHYKLNKLKAFFIFGCFHDLYSPEIHQERLVS